MTSGFNSTTFSSEILPNGPIPASAAHVDPAGPLDNVGPGGADVRRGAERAIEQHPRLARSLRPPPASTSWRRASICATSASPRSLLAHHLGNKPDVLLDPIHRIEELHRNHAIPEVLEQLDVIRVRIGRSKHDVRLERGDLLRVRANRRQPLRPVGDVGPDRVRSQVRHRRNPVTVHQREQNLVSTQHQRDDPLRPLPDVMRPARRIHHGPRERTGLHRHRRLGGPEGGPLVQRLRGVAGG